MSIRRQANRKRERDIIAQINGAPGSGKSVVAASMLETLRKMLGRSKTPQIEQMQPGRKAMCRICSARIDKGDCVLAYELARNEQEYAPRRTMSTMPRKGTWISRDDGETFMSRRPLAFVHIACLLAQDNINVNELTREKWAELYDLAMRRRLLWSV